MEAVIAIICPGNKKWGNRYIWVLDIKLKLFRKLSKMEPNRYHASQNDRAMSMKLKLFLMSLSVKITINKPLHIMPNV